MNIMTVMELVCFIVARATQAGTFLSRGSIMPDRGGGGRSGQGDNCWPTIDRIKSLDYTNPYSMLHEASAGGGGGGGGAQALSNLFKH